MILESGLAEIVSSRRLQQAQEVLGLHLRHLRGGTSFVTRVRKTTPSRGVVFLTLVMPSTSEWHIDVAAFRNRH